MPSDYYDVIICNHVLEQVPNPIETLSIIKSKLNKNGKVVLVIPFEKGRRYSKFDINDKNYHLYSWNVQTLTYLVSQIGFKCIETKILDYGYDRFIASTISKYHLPKLTFNPLFKILNFLRQSKEILLVIERTS
ncbi:methyltransferase domain-containing protein [Flavobacterium myungsuense]|uniref:Methyltransferase domain-containing protein n=1 Tax=Flavobacterium myungsuense TaxID=651823 RepID=A0ABW3J5B2_9FLAO